MTLFGFLVIAVILVEGVAGGGSIGTRLLKEERPLIHAGFEVTWRGVVMSFNADKYYTLRIDEMEFFFNEGITGFRILEGGVGKSFVDIGFTLRSPGPKAYMGVDIYGEVTEGSNTFKENNYKWRYWKTENPSIYYRPGETPPDTLIYNQTTKNEKRVP